jgi:hypothetical protein
VIDEIFLVTVDAIGRLMKAFIASNIDFSFSIWGSRGAARDGD